ncbi:hypothetical protein QE449_003445 [Rhodococcus sp. SORGH_AS303]|nr:hypothetical protein [Rhodococcus sp. SORGH_AS_0303]
MTRRVWLALLPALWSFGLVALLAAVYVLAHGMPS